MKKTGEPFHLEGRTSLVFLDQWSNPVKAILTGRFFFTALVSALFGLTLCNPLPASTDYLNHRVVYGYPILVGTVFELLLIVADCATVILLCPYVKASIQQMALGYLCYRILETVSIGIGIVSVVYLLSLSQSYLTAGHAENSLYDSIGPMANASADRPFIPGPISMIK